MIFKLYCGIFRVLVILIMIVIKYKILYIIFKKVVEVRWFSRWFGSVSHKDIGTLYLLFGLWAGLVGAGFSTILRLQLSKPGNDFVTGHLYNVILTAHGLIMVFWFIIPSLIGGFGN